MSHHQRSTIIQVDIIVSVFVTCTYTMCTISYTQIKGVDWYARLCSTCMCIAFWDGYTYIHTYIYACVCVLAYVRVCARVCVCVCINLHSSTW